MKSYDYNAVTTSEGEVICTKHFPLLNYRSNPPIVNAITLDNPMVSPIFACSEWDHYPVCDMCGHVHDYVGLTTDGQKYEGVTY